MTSRNYEEDYMQLSRYLSDLEAVPEGLTYDEVWEALEVRRPYVARHAPVHRTFEGSGTNNLLDQLNALLLSQCVDMLEVEANTEATNGQLL